MKLRTENAQQVNEIESRLTEGSSELPDDAQYRAHYVSVAEHGIATAEFVYKLRGPDQGWLDTVESWIKTYRAYLLDDEEGMDCGDYHPDFVRFVEESIGANRSDFCVDTYAQSTYDQGSSRTEQLGRNIVLVFTIVLLIGGLLLSQHPRVKRKFSRRRTNLY